MNKSTLQRKLDTLARLNEQAQNVRSEIHDYCIDRWGKDPADLDFDDFIDAENYDDKDFCQPLIEARIAIEEATTPQPAGDWMRCPECGSADLSWSAHATVTNGTPDGRLRANEVNTLFVLGCNYCSETIETLTSDEVARRLSETSQPTTNRKTPDCKPNG